jgi:DNA-binding NarL/FixJ family response regulator
MRILIVDDHEVAREGLRAALSVSARHVIVGAAENAHDALELAVRTSPSVAVVDFRLPDESGDRLCRRLRRAVPGMHVIVLSSYLNEEIVRACLDAGAAAYVTKAAGLGELRAAMDDLEGGRAAERWASASQVVGRLDAISTSRGEGSAPTRHQVRVLELVAQGLTYREIADQLHVSMSTVRFHV